MAKFNFTLLLVLLFTKLILGVDSLNSIHINEFIASNYEFITDPDFNEYSDWIEIYNSGSDPVNLLGYFLTDDLSNPTKWEITTEYIIESASFILFWADGKDGGTHTNFKLSKNGESIGLFAPDGQTIDSIIYTKQVSNVSYGRFPDSSNEWFFFTNPTPGNLNNNIILSGIAPDPTFSASGGFYDGSLSLELTSPLDSVKIYFTTDGSEPSVNDNFYNTPIIITGTSIIRTKAVRDDYLDSPVITNTYLINENISLPVISIATNPDNFWDDEIGIYVAGTNGIPGNCTTQPRNWNQDWERPVSLEFFETDKNLAFKLDAGLKINGGCSRLYPQKSLAVFARDIYGTSKIAHQIFADKPIFEFDNIILRSSAQDWWRTMFRDGMIQTVIKQGTGIDYQTYRPSVVFLNGEFFGIHNIREKLNEHYLEANHGVDPDNIDLIEISKSIKANYGDRVAYDDLINFVSSNDMSLDANYDFALTLIDKDEYIDYQICQIFAANGDWPGSNVKMWRTKNPAGKFRWMIYDLDFGFGGNGDGQYFSNTLGNATEPNGPDWPNPPWSTILFRRMLLNENFRTEFIQRFAVHVNTTFDSTHVLSVIDSIQTLIAPEIPRHIEKWTQSISFGPDWDSIVEVLREFIRLRPEYVREHFHSKFNLSGSSQLFISINNTNAGFIKAQDIKLPPGDFEGIFFNDVPLELEAVAAPGYRFVGWQGSVALSDPAISVILSENSQLNALFETDSLQSSTLVINEINYNSAANFNPEDWIELYNNTDEVINISGWIIKDADDLPYFTFPDSTFINGRDYFIACRDTSLFKLFFPDVDNVFGNLNFGLSGGGDIVRLYNENLNMVDSVEYDDTLPWPPSADGDGSTLELKNPNLENSLSFNWAASPGYGSPGRLNDIFTEASDDYPTLPKVYSLEQNYPNPFNPVTTIRFQIPSAQNVRISIFDVLGNQIETILNKSLSAGVHTVQWNAAKYSSGMYVYQLVAYSSANKDHFTKTQKMMLVK